MINGSTHGVMVTVLDGEHDDPSLKPGRSCLHFT